MTTQTVTVAAADYEVSTMDALRIAAGDWFQDEVVGMVDVTGEGHYAADTIDAPETLEAIAAAIRSERYTARRANAADYCNAQTAYGRSLYR